MAPLAKVQKVKVDGFAADKVIMLRNLRNAFKDRNKKLELLAGIFLLCAMSFVASTRILDPFELLFLDLRFQLRPEIDFPKNIAIIGIDEASIDIFGRWPWARDRHAALLGLLRHEAFRPKVIGYDALFESKNTADLKGDDDLVYQTGNLEKKVIMAYFFEKGPATLYERDESKEKILESFALPPSDSLPENLDEADKVSLPYLELATASSLAFVNNPVDPDGRTRKAQLLMRYQGKIYPSMDFLAALEFLGAGPKDVRIESRAIVIEKAGMEKRTIPINSRGEMLLNYFGRTSKAEEYSFAEVLEAGKVWMNGQPSGVLNALKDKIILVGVTALGIGDRRVTPFHQYEAGIHLHAQTIANILEQKYLMRATPALSYAALIFCGMIVIAMTMFLSIAHSLPAGIFLTLLYFLASLIFFFKGIWIDVAIQEVTMVVLFVGITSFRYFMALEELKRTQAQLIHSAKMASLGQLSAGISHEFRNILNSLNLHIEYCALPTVGEEKIKESLEKVKRIMKNANEILTGLLTFARQSQSIRKPGDLRKTVQETLLLLEKELVYHQIEVKTDFDEDIPMISYDSGQISQVIMNLINNARDAFRSKDEAQENPGKIIVLRVKKDKKNLRLDIEDNGSGIPPQVLKRLFEPFVTSKPAGQGTGLGLSVCHGIIRNHQGDIRVTTAQGKGTTWHIFFPV
ncbi:MAG: CHASE2 domain-containing protein [Candidatus Omnitrophica bacterium]|nr:CHASE2 domain-containing protein [Candidatus Omnitrophota bacterium]